MTVIHILRDPIPWRTERLSECGRSVKSALTADEYIPHVMREPYGVMAPNHPDFNLIAPLPGTVCATCRGRFATRFGRGMVEPLYSWRNDPASIVRRGANRDEVNGTSDMALDLWAIADLVAAHADEFEVRRHAIAVRKGLK